MAYVRKGSLFKKGVLELKFTVFAGRQYVNFR